MLASEQTKENQSQEVVHCSYAVKEVGCSEKLYFRQGVGGKEENVEEYEESEAIALAGPFHFVHYFGVACDFEFLAVGELVVENIGDC